VRELRVVKVTPGHIVKGHFVPSKRNSAGTRAKKKRLKEMIREAQKERGKKKNPRKKTRNGSDSSVRSPTSTSTDVRSPTRTRTATSTDATTTGNITVTGGAGAGANTTVHVHQRKLPDDPKSAPHPERLKNPLPKARFIKAHSIRQNKNGTIDVVVMGRKKR
jgi:hypothetical protein